MDANNIGPIITAVATFIAALGASAAVLISAINHTTIKTTQAEIKSQLQEVKITIDGNLGRMVALAETSGIGEGVRQEREAVKSDAAALVEKAAVVAAELKTSTLG